MRGFLCVSWPSLDYHLYCFRALLQNDLPAASLFIGVGPESVWN